MPDTQERRIEDAEQVAQADVDDLQERGDRVGDDIEQARRDWERTKQDESVPTAAGDWEDTEPDDSTGEDPSGFDDPESVDLDDDDEPAEDDDR